MPEAAKSPLLVKKKISFPFYAGRFAAKEALAKAIGTGIGSHLSWKEMEICSDRYGKPIVVWHRDIALHFGGAQAHLSISHTDSLAIAYAVLE